jgi:hypothetical protein
VKDFASSIKSDEDPGSFVRFLVKKDFNKGKTPQMGTRLEYGFF